MRTQADWRGMPPTSSDSPGHETGLCRLRQPARESEQGNSADADCSASQRCKPNVFGMKRHLVVFVMNAQPSDDDLAGPILSVTLI